MSFEPGERLGPYEIVERLGAGGMGEVFRARDGRLQRDVAIKVLGGPARDDRESLRRFLTEAQAASALNHPNILTVHEIGETASGPYLVTEFVDGSTVRALLRDGPLPLDRALRILIEACGGLAKAHDAGILHRDIKPENLMVTRDGYAKILDFGLAKITASDAETMATATAPMATASGAVVGTLTYMAPEQFRGRPANVRSDLYALGLVAYEMISGRNPFKRATLAETMQAILHETPPALEVLIPNVPDDLSRLVAGCIDRDPDRRPTDARALCSGFEQVRARLSGVAVPAAQAGGRRGRRIGLAVAAVVFASAAVATVALLRRPEPPSVSSAPSATRARGLDLAQGRKVVAVLPVRDGSDDPELERAGIGAILADALVQVLADRQEFYVASPVRLETAARTIGRPLGEVSADPAYARRIGLEVDADYVLTGDLARVGGTYLLSATLTDLRTGNVSGSFRAETRDRDRLLAELTSGIGAGVQRQFGAEAAAAGPDVGRVATSSVEAYAHFVRGMNHTYVGEWERAIRELNEAVKIDPQMGIAWTELACAHSFAGDDARSAAAQREAERLLDRVNDKERLWIEMNGIWINSGNGPAYLEAARAFVAAYPDDREGYFYAGLGAEYLLDDCRQALSWYEKAYRLTPIFYPITKGLVDCHLKLGRRDRAVQALERYLALGTAGELGRAQARGRLDDLKQ